MKAFHRKRLLKLADRLDEVEPRHFDMHVWAVGEMPCKTAGCAVGYATTIPSFRRAGLRLQPAKASRHNFIPVFEGFTHFAAARRFFGVPAVEASNLFSPESYDADNPRPKTVAKRIRKFVEDYTGGAATS